MIYIGVFDDSFPNDRTLSIFVLEIVLADGTNFPYIMHAIDASKHTWTDVSRLLQILSCFSSISFMGVVSSTVVNRLLFLKACTKIFHVLHSIITSILTKLTIFINGFRHLFHPQSFKMQLYTFELKTIQASMCSNLVIAQKKNSSYA